MAASLKFPICQDDMKSEQVFLVERRLRDETDPWKWEVMERGSHDAFRTQREADAFVDELMNADNGEFVYRVLTLNPST
jgi:hypothetical protein